MSRDRTTFDDVYTDRLGEIRVRYCHTDFVVGPDSPLIKLRSRFGATAFGGFRASPSDVDLATVAALGLAGNAHIIDCTSDDPTRYLFAYYGMKSRVEDRRNFQNRRIAEAAWPALRDFGASDYSRIKCGGQSDLVAVEYVLNGRRTSYRRLAVPLADHGREVTHLLVAMILQEVEVPLGPHDEMGSRVLGRVDQLVPAGGPEVAVDQRPAAMGAIRRR